MLLVLFLQLDQLDLQLEGMLLSEVVMVPSLKWFSNKELEWRTSLRGTPENRCTLLIRINAQKLILSRSLALPVHLFLCLSATHNNAFRQYE